MKRDDIMYHYYVGADGAIIHEPRLDQVSMVNHPPHYTTGNIEVIDYIEDKNLDYHLGNAVKYISRAGRKGDAVEDLQKAEWYLRRAIELRGGNDADG